MPFTVLKISKADEGRNEVLGEFWDIEVARKFTDFLRREDPDGEYTYQMEEPPGPAERLVSASEAEPDILDAGALEESSYNEYFTGQVDWSARPANRSNSSNANA